jgi:hypothetical protein
MAFAPSAALARLRDRPCARPWPCDRLVRVSPGLLLVSFGIVNSRPCYSVMTPRTSSRGHSSIYGGTLFSPETAFDAHHSGVFALEPPIGLLLHFEGGTAARGWITRRQTTRNRSELPHTLSAPASFAAEPALQRATGQLWRDSTGSTRTASRANSRSAGLAETCGRLCPSGQTP